MIFSKIYFLYNCELHFSKRLISRLLIFILSSILLIYGQQALAHPVSYAKSKGLMGYHSPMISHNQINYSFKYWFAAGVHHIRRPNIKNRHATFASTNFLLKRWNGSGLQANLYSVFGAGVSELGPTSEPSGLGLIQFDIEDRRLYFLAKHSAVVNEERSDMQQTVVRFGFAPYVVGYEGIHSWLILEWQNTDFTDGKDISDMTPFLRVFYKNLLFEVGQSFDGLTKFNYITHF